MKIINKLTSEIIPYIRNNKIHSENQIKMIAASITEFGFKNPVIIDLDNNIIAGHGRLLAAEKIGLKKVPCIIADDLTPNQIKAYRIADNKLASLAEWDEEMLSLELSDLQDFDFNFECMGFDDKEVQDIIDQFSDNPDTTGDDEVEDNVPAITKLGDLWELGNHRLLCGDSTNKKTVDILMDGQKADMVFTDPPYGMGLDTDWSDAKSSLKFAKEKNALGGKKYEKVIGDNEDFTPDLIKTVFDNFGYCKEIFLWGADYYAEYLVGKNEGSWIVWDKRLDESADKMYGSTFELCWSKKKHKRMLARIKWAGIFGTEKEFDHKRHHPTQKPIALVDWFFDYYSLADKKKVADLYGGLGGTLISCEKNNKISYIMELDPHYCDVTVNRYKTWCETNGRTPVIKLNGEVWNA